MGVPPNGWFIMENPIKNGGFEIVLEILGRHPSVGLNLPSKWEAETPSTSCLRHFQGILCLPGRIGTEHRAQIPMSLLGILWGDEEIGHPQRKSNNRDSSNILSEISFCFIDLWEDESKPTRAISGRIERAKVVHFP